MDDMELELLVSICAWAVGAFICGLCGLGVAIVAVPLMMLVMPVQKVVLIACLTALGLTGVMAVYYHKHCPWKTVLWMIVGAIPGSVVGIYILKYMPARMLEIIVGIMLFFCIVGIQFLQNRIRVADRPRNAIITGFLGGVIGTSITIDGAVVGLYGLLIGLDPMSFLGFTSMFFFLRNVVSDSMQALSGLYTGEIVTYALYCIPASLLGFALSIPLVRKINVNLFRAVVKVVIVLAAIMCLAKGIL